MELICITVVVCVFIVCEALPEIINSLKKK